MPRVFQCRNSEYGKVLIKTGFSKCKSTEYILSSKYARILNMQELYWDRNMPQHC